MWNIPSKEKLASIPDLCETENIPIEEKLVHLHFFIGSCDWWITEFDGKDTFFGFACLGDPAMAEWGYLSFRELKNATAGPLEVDREVNWKIKPVKEIPRLKEAACR